MDCAFTSPHIFRELPNHSVLSLQKKYKFETEVENWIQKYDQDMGERQVSK